eukprot:TRINITY_DN12342_c0_g1_i2.p1 TRINITY_DN12342_c0_g1~~TRINITY_DN12342_c0_g1_i2.p1  ORF type:complete len:237 (-),score=55.95 TRINITY_DN12342_c0_g1_i2:69-779(-)
MALENMRLLDDGTTAWIEALRVHPDARGQGIAAKLQQFVVKTAFQNPSVQRVRYTTGAYNTASVKLAERCGLTEDRRWGVMLSSGDTLDAFKSAVARAVAAHPESSSLKKGNSANVLRMAAEEDLIDDWTVHSKSSGAGFLKQDHTVLVGPHSVCWGRLREEFSGMISVFTVSTTVLSECIQHIAWRVESAPEVSSFMFFVDCSLVQQLCELGVMGNMAVGGSQCKESILFERKRS